MQHVQIIERNVLNLFIHIYIVYCVSYIFFCILLCNCLCCISMGNLRCQKSHSLHTQQHNKISTWIVLHSTKMRCLFFTHIYFCGNAKRLLLLLSPLFPVSWTTNCPLLKEIQQQEEEEKSWEGSPSTIHLNNSTTATST